MIPPQEDSVSSNSHSVTTLPARTTRSQSRQTPELIQKTQEGQLKSQQTHQACRTLKFNEHLGIPNSDQISAERTDISPAKERAKSSEGTSKAKEPVKRSFDTIQEVQMLPSQFMFPYQHNQAAIDNSSVDSLMPHPMTTLIGEFQNQKLNAVAQLKGENQSVTVDKPTVFQFQQRLESVMVDVEEAYQTHKSAFKQRQAADAQIDGQLGFNRDLSNDQIVTGAFITALQPSTSQQALCDQSQQLAGSGRDGNVVGSNQMSFTAPKRSVQNDQSSCSVSQTLNVDPSRHETFRFVPNSLHFFYPKQVQRCLNKRSNSHSKVSGASSISSASVSVSGVVAPTNHNFDKIVSGLKMPTSRAKCMKMAKKMKALAQCQVNFMQVLLQKTHRRVKPIKKQEKIINTNLKRKRIFLDKENFDIVGVLQQALRNQDGSVANNSMMGASMSEDNPTPPRVTDTPRQSQMPMPRSMFAPANKAMIQEKLGAEDATMNDNFVFPEQPGQKAQPLNAGLEIQKLRSLSENHAQSDKKHSDEHAISSPGSKKMLALADDRNARNIEKAQQSKKLTPVKLKGAKGKRQAKQKVSPQTQHEEIKQEEKLQLEAPKDAETIERERLTVTSAALNTKIGLNQHFSFLPQTTSTPSILLPVQHNDVEMVEEPFDTQAREFANEAPKASGMKISLTRQGASPTKKGGEIKQKSPPKKKQLKKGRKDLVDVDVAKATEVSQALDEEPEEKITPQSALKQPVSSDTEMMVQQNVFNQDIGNQMDQFASNGMDQDNQNTQMQRWGEEPQSLHQQPSMPSAASFMNHNHGLQHDRFSLDQGAQSHVSLLDNAFMKMDAQEVQMGVPQSQYGDMQDLVVEQQDTVLSGQHGVYPVGSMNPQHDDVAAGQIVNGGVQHQHQHFHQHHHVHSHFHYNNFDIQKLTRSQSMTQPQQNLGMNLFPFNSFNNAHNPIQGVQTPTATVQQATPKNETSAVTTQACQAIPAPGQNPQQQQQASQLAAQATAAAVNLQSTFCAAHQHIDNTSSYCEFHRPSANGALNNSNTQLASGQQGTPLQLQQQPHSYPFAIRGFDVNPTPPQMGQLASGQGFQNGSATRGMGPFLNGITCGRQDCSAFNAGGKNQPRSFLSPQEYKNHLNNQTVQSGANGNQTAQSPAGQRFAPVSSGENLGSLEVPAMAVGEDNFFDVTVADGATAGGNGNFLGGASQQSNHKKQQQPQY